MSNIIKSFRVIEDNSPKNISSEEKEPEDEIDFEEIEKKIEDMEIKAKDEANRIIDEAEKKATDIITSAKMEEREIKKSAEAESLILREESKIKGYDLGYKDGYEEGYKESYNQGKVEIDNTVEEILALKEKHISDWQRLLDDLEPEIVEMIIDIYEKIIGNRLDTDEEYILDLVSNGIKNLDPTEKLTIIVSKSDYELLLENKDRILAEASLINELEIKHDNNFVKGDCILETPKGNIDLSVKDQIVEVDNMLRKILNNE